MNLKFQEWPKIHRLYRDVIITEKIDGSNGCIVVDPVSDYESIGMSHRQSYGPHDFQDGQAVGGRMDSDSGPGVIVKLTPVDAYVVYAQSRKKVIAPGKQTDNYGFAGFVRDNAQEIVEKLGPGRHFGEWYGNGIQGGYGMAKGDKRFALFNASRWLLEPLPPQVTTVPIIYEGVFTDESVQYALRSVRSGSWAKGATGRAQAEGVVVYFKQSNTSFKALLADDDVSKFEAAQRRIVLA